jgi:hypothetical protein
MDLIQCVNQWHILSINCIVYEYEAGEKNVTYTHTNLKIYYKHMQSKLLI